ncbi:ATP-binding cassette domain-containing protein [Chitinibacteraceae bacterium HSL-7]
MAARHAQAPATVKVRGLQHWFGIAEARKQVLFDIDLDILAGELTILMGASGSGKTTLLTLAGCLRDVQQGSIRLLGQELMGADQSALMQARRQLGFIFQAHNLHESLTAMQNVRLGLEVHGGQAARNWEAPAAHLLELLGLCGRLDYLPSRLSGGQKQRVAIARALIGNPLVVFADEPTAALDRDSALQVVHLLKNLARERGTTVLMVTHDSKVIDLADRIVTMEQGRLIEDRRLAAWV